MAEIDQKGRFSPDLIARLNKSDDAKALADWVHSQYQMAKRARQPFERQWYLNYAFYTGRQYVKFMGPGMPGGIVGKLYTPAAPKWRVRSVTNRIKPIVRTELSKLTSNRPNASVVPASTDDADLFAAQAGEAVWEYHYSMMKLHKKFTDAMFWMTICGTAYIKDWWDPDSVIGPQAYEGNISYGAVTPFHVFVPDIDLSDIEEQPYVINAYTRPVEWVMRNYGLQVKPTVISAHEIMGEGFFKITQTSDTKPDSVLAIEMWLKPGAHRLLPDGGMITLIDRQIVALHDQGLPYDHGEYPFTKFTHIPTGQYYGSSVIEDLIGPQRDFNKTRSQIIEAKDRTAKPQLMAPRGSVDVKKMTTQPGQVIEYRPGVNPPQPLPMQGLPGYVLEELNRVISDMEDLSSQHQVSRGEAPPGVTAATAINYLQERDDSVLSPTFHDVEAGWEKIAKHTLSHVVQFWDTERIITVTGSDGSFDSITLKGSVVATGTDIRMEAGSALPTSKSARQAFLLDMMGKGYIDPNKGLSMMDMGGLEKIYDDLKADEKQIQRENLRMRRLDLQEIEQHLQNRQALVESGTFQTDKVSGQPIEMPENMVSVNTWDNHQLHIEIHNKFRKSQAFELLAKPIKDQFEAHIMAHAMALQQSMMAMQNMGAAPPNAPGPEPGAGNNQFSDVPPVGE